MRLSGGDVRILAVDPAGRGACGIADGYCGDNPKLYSVRFWRDPSDTNVIVFGRALTFFEMRHKDWQPNLVAIEQPLVMHNPFVLCGIYAIVTGFFRSRGIPILPVSIATWRKFFLGAGKLNGPTAKKRAIMVAKGLGWNPENHDQAEAAGIFAYACSQAVPMLVQQPEPLFTGVAQ